MSKSHAPTVAIIGAGLGGISAAIALKTQLNFDNFVIYEKADDIGGTWRANTYPGCGSDIPGHWYSLSTELNPYWSSYLVGQQEIQAYWGNLWQKYKLESHTKLGHLVKYAEWDAQLQRYRLQIQKVATGETFEAEAEVIFHALGGFLHPSFPEDIKGVDSFRGNAWHSATWNHDVDLAGKRVGVIGNGCSAAQFIPEIAQDLSTTVINFARTPQWYAPRPETQYPGWLKWAFARVPFVARMYRLFLVAKTEILFLIFRKQNGLILRLMRRLFISYIEHTAPKKYLDQLIPDYPVGCKRIIVDPGYLKCLHQPNVSLRWESIESVVEEGIKLKTGEIVPLDVIIFATGYTLTTAELTIRGSKGLNYLEYMSQHGGAAAYLGTCVPGFPNLFHLLGPNTVTGHSSVVFIEEVQINYAIQLIKHIIEGRAKSFEVKEEVCDEYNEWVQEGLSTRVWTECNSYYQADRNKKTKNIAGFPGPGLLFWWKLRKAEVDEYEIVE